MKSVWKYDIDFRKAPGDCIALELPRGAQALCVQMQGDTPMLWALVDLAKANDLQPRTFRWSGTGHPMGDGEYAYIGTIQMAEGRLVFHLFEVAPPDGNAGGRA